MRSAEVACHYVQTRRVHSCTCLACRLLHMTSLCPIYFLALALLHIPDPLYLPILTVLDDGDVRCVWWQQDRYAEAGEGELNDSSKEMEQDSRFVTHPAAWIWRPEARLVGADKYPWSLNVQSFALVFDTETASLVHAREGSPFRPCTPSSAFRPCLCPFALQPMVLLVLLSPSLVPGQIRSSP
jgi:hypothetical protein